MDPAQDEVLQTLGQLIYGNLINAAGFTLVYGAYVVLTCIAVSILWNKRATATYYRLRLIITTLIVFVWTTALWVGQISIRTNQIKIALMAGPNVALADRVSATKNWSEVSVMNNWFASTNMLYADAILICNSGRAWIICTDKRKWISIPIVLWILDLASALFSNISLIISHKNDTYSKKFTYGAGAALGCSFLANLAATVIIATTVYAYRRSIANGLSRKYSPASRVGWVFVESGFAYCIIQLAVFFTNLFTNSGTKQGTLRNTGSTMYQTLAYIAALYPTLVIIIVNINRSFLDTTMHSFKEGDVTFSSGITSSAATPAFQERSITFARTRSELGHGKGSLDFDRLTHTVLDYAHETGERDSGGAIPLEPMVFSSNEDMRVRK